MTALMRNIRIAQWHCQIQRRQLGLIGVHSDSLIT